MPPPKFPAKRQEQQPAAESPTASDNPLAGLLGYGGDESDEESEGQPKQAGQPPSAEQQQQQLEQPAPGQEPAGPVKDLDAEVRRARQIGREWACDSRRLQQIAWPPASDTQL